MERLGGEVKRELSRFGTAGAMTELVAAWPAAGEKPGLSSRLPERGENDIRIMRVEHHIDPAGIFVFRENFRPRFAAVACPENSPFRIWAKGVTKRGHEYDIWIIRMNDERADLARVAQPDIFPVLSGIDRFVNTGAVSGVPANGGFAGADVNSVVIGWRDREGADRRNVLLIKERRPIRAAVQRFPDSARNGAKVPGVRFPRHALNRQGASTAEWSDLSPLHSGEKSRIDLRRRAGRWARQRRWRSAHGTG